MNTPLKGNRRFFAAAVAALVLVLVTACGGGGEDGRASTAGTRATALSAARSPGKKPRGSVVVTNYATGLTSPRGLAFGADGDLYVAEAGTGGSLVPLGTADCPSDINIYSPYTAGYSGRVLRLKPDGTKQTVADRLPSMTDAYGGNYGPTDLAIVNGS
jgi:hypothetical protein